MKSFPSWHAHRSERHSDCIRSSSAPPGDDPAVLNLKGILSVQDDSPTHSSRVVVDGKFFRQGSSKWYAKGLTYGPFARNSRGEALPEEEQVLRDFAHLRGLGANALRLYFPPPLQFLDLAQEFDLKVLIDVPWEKHRCFFEDWDAMQSARNTIRTVAQELGNHPALLAISVVNEFPNDIVRFYGHRRLERFVDELLDLVHQEAPQCLATFANFPTTEFLQPRNLDFHCFNVYLHDPVILGSYLDRLQHIANGMPLLLGEYGIDSLREGESAQAETLANHVETVFSHGLSGSFVFSYTDEWFTGGHLIEDWKFGVTRSDRSEKAAAFAVRDAWSRLPAKLLPEDPPMVSVVVCTYNGARTLNECLESLMRLDYPDFEVILVDDGSRDATPQIAAEFPQVHVIRQENRGLSVARNVGAKAARGEIIAYTDDDCVADENWLLYLVLGMRDQNVAAIGGPNITPPSDNWIAKCVAVSPGNPSHVMLDDRRAEHVPGCNMAVRRDVLLNLGGFDPQYRAAGDDVDLCWRLMDQGYDIGFAPGAMVWHHRRCSIKTYFKQQKGYGRAEAMVQFKHPQRFSRSGNPSFGGVLYGDGAVGLPVTPPRIYHGRFGSALFQTIYRQQVYGWRAWVTSLEWHALAVFVLLLGLLNPWSAVAAGLLWTLTLIAVMKAGLEAILPPDAPLWCRPLVMFLHLTQPVVRGGQRVLYRQFHKRLPRLETPANSESGLVKPISLTTRDLYWDSQSGVGREQLLEALIAEAQAYCWSGDFQGGWVEWDVELIGDPWRHIRIRTVTEELGWPRRFTRARCTASLTDTSRLTACFLIAWIVAGIFTGSAWGCLIGLIALGALFGLWEFSRIRCLKAVIALMRRASLRAGLAEPAEGLWSEEELSEDSGDRVPASEKDLVLELSTLPPL